LRQSETYRATPDAEAQNDDLRVPAPDASEPTPQPRRRRPWARPLRHPLRWHTFAVNAAILVLVALALLVTPLTISAPIKVAEATIVLAGLLVALVANLVLTARALRPLELVATRMEHIDLFAPRQRIEAVVGGPVGRIVGAFNRMLDRLEAERGDSARAALAAQEAERRRIARGLHDEVGQVLTGVLLQLGSVSGAVAPERRHEIAETSESVRQALEEVRRISAELRPHMLEHLGLVSALTELTRTFSRLSGIAVERDFGADLPTLAPETELAFYRIAQESLTNVARHSEATGVSVSLRALPSQVVLRIVDDGRGLEGAEARGGGTRGMRERAILIGAKLTIGPAEPRGVEVRLETPVADAAPVRVQR
jgi:two-component system sensor histidine kinase UhpB